MAGEEDRAFELEGMVSALSVLRVLSPDLATLSVQLAKKLESSRSLLAGAPLLLDLTALDSNVETDGTPRSGVELRLAPLVELLRNLGLAPVALCGATGARREEALAAGLGLLEARETPKREPRPARAETQARAAPAAAPGSLPPAPTALMLTQPLRSGQIVYAEQRDAVVLSTVNPGAELIADGNIHVYGALRGRALAGAHGNEQARIFCLRLEADLVSIAGIYLSADELPEDRRGQAVQIYVRDGQLVIADLSAPSATAPTIAHL